MVRINVKLGDDSSENEFLYDCMSNLLIEEIASEIVGISNLQSKIHRIVSKLEPCLLHLYGDPKGTLLLRALSEAKSYTSKDMVIHNRPLSYLVLKYHFETIERELIAKFDLLGFSHSQYQQLLSDVRLHDESTTQLKLAGKVLMREKQLSDYIGRNEKTKIVLKLQSKLTPPS